MDFFIFTIFILVTMLYTWWNTKSVNKESSYLVADRKTTLFSLVATLVMTEFNTSTLIGFSSLGAVGGIWAIAMPFVFLVGLGFYTFAVAKKWKEFNGFSTAGFFTKIYGSNMGKTVSVFLILAMLGFSATYVKSMTYIYMPLFGDNIIKDEWIFSFLVSFLVWGFAIRGGLISIIRLDRIGFFSVVVIIPLLFVFSSEGSLPSFRIMVNHIPIESGMKALPPQFVLSLILLTMFTYISAPWYSQKIFSAESSRTAILAVGISSILVFILYSFPVLAVANYSIINPNISPEKILPDILDKMFPMGIRGISYAAILLIGSTTLAGVWSAINTMIVSDFLMENLDNENRELSQKLKNQKGLKRSFIIFSGLALVSWLLSNVFVEKILSQLILANIPILAISFSLLAGFYWKGVTKMGAISSMVAGFSWGVFSYVYWGETGGYTLYWVYGGIPLVFIVGYLVSILDSILFSKH